ncbi:MAG: metal ABC transporter ATP-binding protein [Patescibacteria group bacterium]
MPNFKKENEIVLEVKNLSVALDGRTILNNISFAIKKGDTLAIIGPNGAGKSVLFRALLGFLPSQGLIKWKEGVKIGYAPQRFFIEKQLPLSVKEFFLLKAAGFWFLKPEFIRRVLGELKAVGLADHILQERLGELSGGELQRVLIAWVMIDRPDVLLLDEPAAGVDIGFEETIYTLIHQMQDKLGITVLLISHDLNVVYRYAEEVLCLNHKMICQGPPREVLHPEELARLYGGGSFYLHEKAAG